MEFLNPCMGTLEVRVSAPAPDSAEIHERVHETSARSTAVVFLCGMNTVTVQLKQVLKQPAASNNSLFYMSQQSNCCVINNELNLE